MNTTTADRDLLARLGLEPGADANRIREAHAALVAFLATAPKAVRPWVRRQQAEIEAAYRDLQAHQPVPRTAASAARPTNGRGYVAFDGEDAEELLDALDDSRRPAPRVSVPHKPVRANPVTRTVESGPGMRFGGGTRRLGLALGGLAVVAIAVVGIYKLGDSSIPGLTGSPAPAATEAALDEARVLELMQQLNTNPRDVAVLRELADLYYAAGDNTTSHTWLLKVLEIEPQNIEALLGSGATAYNLDDFAAAEEAWRAVLAIEPDNIDAHYDLGLMYFSMDPPKLDQMRAAWNKVIELAPDSQLASIVRTHMPAESGSPAASSAPAASAQPTTAPASPAASPAPAAS